MEDATLENSAMKIVSLLLWQKKTGTLVHMPALALFTFLSVLLLNEKLLQCEP